MSLPNEIIPVGLLGTGAAAERIDIERSVRFNSSDSAYLSRTPASAGNRKTWTWAGWVKLSKNSGFVTLFDVNPTSPTASNIIFESEKLRYADYNSSYTTRVTSSAVFRDFSAWYHILCAYDSTQATASNRVKLYVNGSQITQLSTSSYPSQDYDSFINTTSEHGIGGRTSGQYLLDGYLADVHFIDGGTPSTAIDSDGSVTGIVGAEYLLDFGEFDSNGIWQPKAYTGSYNVGAGAVNGFHLDFSDNSTAAALGTDTSGNGNDWTVNNLEVAGTTVYSDNVTINGTVSSGIPRNIFDGLTSTGYSVLNNGGGSYIEVTFSPSLSASSKFEFYWNGDSFSSYGYSLNGGSTVFIGTSTGKWQDLGAVGTVSSIKLIQISGRNGIGAGRVRAIRLNGNILVDPVFGDSFVDVPTNGTETDTGVGGEVRGNYATLNPLLPTLTPTNGNLDTPNSVGQNYSTIAVSSGKWYIESTVGPITTTTACGLGVAFGATSDSSGGYYNAGAYVGLLYSNNLVIYTGVYPGGTSNAITASSGSILAIAVDLDSGTQTISYYLNNSLITSSNLPSGKTWFITTRQNNNQSLNFGQRPFAHQAPSGFKALCTANLPAPVVTKPSTVMDVALDTGANILSAAKALCGGNANFLWIKDRVNGSTNHHLIDIVRDPQLDGTPFLASNSTSNEATLGSYSAPSGNSVGWAWYAGGSTVSNTDGSITSSVRANASAGFSIVTYTGNGTNDSTVGHGLGAKPALTITKNRSSVANWIVYTDIIDGSLDFLFLDSTNAKTDSGAIIPTTTVVYRGSALSNNTLGEDYVMYCFAPVDGYSSFGSYTGNGSADGPFVYTGFRPRWVMVKRTDSTGNWVIMDARRDAYNYSISYLSGNLADAEGSFVGNGFSLVSNGFKLEQTTNSTNTSAATHIYAAFAENPFALNARAR